eukprot:GHVH01001031.1.p1 GENE.GHVH01001031.1~~GHVH01001031.1.p1  ORF type:complete len:868 (-),score=149.92 GHVH01001031.1:872-3475(-)
MSTWMSEKMKYGTLVVPTDGAKAILNYLGHDSFVQFVDMNDRAMLRPFRNNIIQLDETEKQLQFLIDTISNLPGATFEDRKVDPFLNVTCDRYDFKNVQGQVKSLYDEFIAFTANNSAILQRINYAYEHREMCQFSKSLLEKDSSPKASSQVNAVERQSSRLDNLTEAATAALGRPQIGAGIISVISGVVEVENAGRLRRAVHYTTRGNVFMEFKTLVLDEYNTEYMKDNSKKARKKADKELKKHGKLVKKLDYDPSSKQAFVFIFQGSVNSVTYTKIKRAVDGADAREYGWPKSCNDAEAQISKLNDQIGAERQALDHYSVLLLHEIQGLLELTIEGGNSVIGDWNFFIQMEKCTYAALDMFEEKADSLQCDLWIPEFEEDKLRGRLRQLSKFGYDGAFLLTDGVVPDKRLVVPTFFRNTGFTRGYQNFVNTYGVPRYREINPAVITSVTLPYLFGVMYGDVGHGIFVTAFGLTLILAYDKLRIQKEEIVQMILGGRYIIFMMGIFAIYSGFIYNDILSLGVDLFGTRYSPQTVVGDKRTWEVSPNEEYFPYPFGFDPVWKSAENELTFLNSFKMKFSIIVAGWHMGLGVVFKGANAVLKKDAISFTCEFIPQMLLFTLFVFYIDFMIIYKWVTPGGAPNLINAIIEYAMLTEPSIELYDNQQTIQMWMVLVMVLTIPWMLIPKPILELLKSKKNDKKRNTEIANLQLDAVESGATTDEGKDAKVDLIKQPVYDEDSFQFGEEMIHQLIETIEFVLGAISNTASYLRLWALSLAHQQLAIVFFDMTLATAIEADMSTAVQTLMMVVMFGAFAGATFVVMLCMDTLECYLHALRLQWVEFQSKFFKADGTIFHAFNFEVILKHFEDE